MNNIRVRLAIGAFIVISVVVVLFMSISQESITYFHSVNEVLDNPEDFQSKNIRVMGFVQPQSSQWNPETLELSFEITEDNQLFLPVKFVGIKPDMFREGQGVVVEGVMGSKQDFLADTLLVKHSEDYKGPDEQEMREKYYDSIKSELKKEINT